MYLGSTCVFCKWIHLHLCIYQTLLSRAVVKSTFVKSESRPSPKRFESESSPSPKRFESKSSPSPNETVKTEK